LQYIAGAAYDYSISNFYVRPKRRQKIYLYKV